MKAKDYITKISRALLTRNDVVWKTYPLQYQGGNFELLKIQSKKINPKDKVILITSWIHGEEISGPLSLLSYIHKIIDTIHSHGYKAIIYPLTNPSGFQQGTRFNIDNDSWTCGNNDFLRYKLANGNIVDELWDKETYTQRYRSSDPKIKEKLPLETALLHRLIKQDPLKQIVVSIDFHQDYLRKNYEISAYHYAFGNLAHYAPIIHELKKYIPLLSQKSISSWYQSRRWIKSTQDGFIVRHDGSITDIMWRLGVPYTIAVETTGKTPLPLAKKINRLWIKWLVLLLDHDTPCWSQKHSSSKNEQRKKKC